MVRDVFILIGICINCCRPANFMDILLPPKWLKKLCLSVEVFLMVEQDPFGICNDRYTWPVSVKAHRRVFSGLNKVP